MSRFSRAVAAAAVTVVAAALLQASDAVRDAGRNLAAGRQFSASTVNGGYSAANAGDGNVNTYWESTDSDLPQWLQVDLGSSVRVGRAVLRLAPATARGTRTQTIAVQGSSNGRTFTTLSAAAGRAFNPAAGHTVTIALPAAAVRYLRLTVTGNTGWPSRQISEFEIYGATGPAGPEPGLTPDVNLAAGKPIEASSSVSTFVAGNANDTSLTSYWEASGHPSTLTVQLGADASLDSVVVRLNSDPGWGSRTQNIQILGRAQGATAFTSLKARADYAFNPSTNQNSVTIPVPGRVADVQLKFFGNTGAPGGQVADLQVVGEWAPNPNLVVGHAPGPDLQVLSIGSSPANPAVGTSVTFTVVVNNRGISATGASTTRLTVGGTTLTGPTPAIAGGASAAVTISGSWKATSGGNTLNAKADSTNTVAESDENDNTLSRAIVVGRGAEVPYFTYEAEAVNYHGTLLNTDTRRTFGRTNFATESSGRQSVRLTRIGQFVEVTSTSAANSIVVRSSIPDSPGGGGQAATISLYIDGRFAQKLTLSSRNSWLYGTTDDTEVLSNSPSADARRLFDESHALLPQSFPAGTKFRLQRDVTDTASFYVIDLIDLEQVAPAASRPAGCTSITDYGAVPNDNVDDSAAIQRAVTDDENGVIGCVWIPAGQWRQQQKILSPDPARGKYNQRGLRNVVIRGAGMWHSQLYTNTEPQNVVGNINDPQEGNVGFDIDDNTQISDLAVFGMTTNRANGGHGLNGRFGKNTKIKNVWIEHVDVGAWVGVDYSDTPAYWNPGDGLEFTGMRIRNTYADGINFANGTRNSTVYNSSFRTTGDDSLAVWANPFVKDQSVDIGHDNHFLNNTIQLPWRANGIAVYGGHGNSIENNLVSDTMTYPGIMLATDHSPLPFSGNTLIANNGLFRCGGVFWDEQQEFGAITLFPSTSPITGVTIRDTDIVDSTYAGIQFKSGSGRMSDVAIANVRIDKSNNGSGILAMRGARGNATLSNVTITNSAQGDIRIEPGSGFTIPGN